MASIFLTSSFENPTSDNNLIRSRLRKSTLLLNKWNSRTYLLPIKSTPKRFPSENICRCSRSSRVLLDRLEFNLRLRVSLVVCWDRIAFKMLWVLFYKQNGQFDINFRLKGREIFPGVWYFLYGKNVVLHNMEKCRIFASKEHLFNIG